MIAKCANKNVSKNVSKNISKSIKTLTAVLLTTMAPFSVSQAQSAFDCFYVGAGIGLASTSARINSQVYSDIAIPGDFNHSAISSHSLYKDSVFGDLYAGYGYTFCPFYLAGEISLKIWNPNSSNNNVYASNFVELRLTDNPSINFNKIEFDLDLRPGYLLTDCSLIYGRIGIAFNKFSLNSNTSASFFTNDVAVPNNLTSSNNKSAVGLRLGLGIEQKICDCFSVRLDYVGTHFRRINIQESQRTVGFIDDEIPVPLPNTLNATRNLRVIDHSFMLGLSYYW